MKAFVLHFLLQLKMDIRNRGTLLTYYLIPILFYAVMGAVFSSIQPQAKQTLAATMSLFAISMGAVLGIPPTLVRLRETGALRAYRVSGIPGWSVLSTLSLSAFIHLFIVSTVIFISAPILFGAALPANLLVYLSILILFTFASIALGIFIGVVAKNQSAATILSQAVFLPSLLLGGLMFPATMLPVPMQWFGKLFPASHAMEAMLNFSFGQSSDTAIVAIASIVFIFVLAAILGLMRFQKVSRTI